ncbi:hypothetical protein MCEMRE195_00053 [Candidatus Nanopelagicaceae bacterium]
MSGMWEERRPSRVKVLHTYTKRAIRWRRNNSPFLSGDLFSDNSDISMYPPRFRGSQPTLKRISEARVIFCPSNRLNEFLEDYNSSISASVIICGNSDFEFHELPSPLPPSVKQLFLQNSFISDDPLVSTLPIGIENFRWGVNGNPKFMNSHIPFMARKSEVLIGPFGLTHPIRSEIRENFSEGVPGACLLTERYGPKEYSTIASNYKFVGAVRGNGVDTHRLWETLYRGSIPVIQNDDWAKGLRGLNLPIIEIDNWEEREILEIARSPIDRGFDAEKIEALWWPFWKKLISTYL